MAAGADDEGLAPYFRHEGCPRGLARSGFSEVDELGDVVDSHRGAVLAQFAVPPAEPVDQLLARDGDRDRGGVMNDRAPVVCEGYPAESCYQVRLVLASYPGLEAGPQPASRSDLGLVAGRHLDDGGLVLGC